MNACLALLGLPGGYEIIIIGVIALLLFGSRLPKVAKSMGKSIVEFKKGIKGVQDEIEDAGEDSPPPSGDNAPPPPGDEPAHREKGDLSDPGKNASN